MEYKEYKTADKSAWGAGPWQDEPDKIQFTDEATGYPCLIVRNQGGALCGYVGVPEGHQFFGKDYDDVAQKDGEYIDVHGGLTFARFCAEGENEARFVCHVPSAGEPDRVWWLGFDCAHCGDLSPGYDAKIANNFRDYDATYKTIDYVKNEIRKLANQIKEAA